MRTTLISGGWIVTMDRQATEIRSGDVLVQDGTITAVTPAGDDPPRRAARRGEQPSGAPTELEVIDATGMVVLPGLVDTHRHTWQTPLRQLGAQWSMDDYRRRMFTEIGPRYRPEDVYAGTLLGALSALDSGVTTLVDWAHIEHTPEHSDASVAALRDAGIRAVFAHSPAITGKPRPHPSDIRRLRTAALADDTAMVTLAMGAAGPDYAGIEITRSDFALARELAIPITTHVASGRFGASRRGIAELDEAGLLGPDLTIVHANGATASDLPRLADHGVSVSISPQIELTMPGLGASVALRALLDAGVRPGLSVDSETVAAPDLFTQMRFALAAHRAGGSDDEAPLPSAEPLRMATMDGARTIGMVDRIGSVEPGKAADLVLLRADTAGLAPLHHAAEAVVLAAHPGLVDTVLVAGQVVKRSGVLLADLGRAIELARVTAASVGAWADG